jgi:hypothetical protein
VDVDNRKWGVLPGTFVHVDLQLRAPPSPLIPDESIVIQNGKTMVCIVENEHAHYVAVELGYNDGSDVRVLQGLSGGETIGLDVPVEVQEADVVQAMPKQQPPGK